MTATRAAWWVLVPIAVVLVVIGWPMGAIVHQSFTPSDTGFVTANPWPTTPAKSTTWNAVWTSLLVAGLSTLGCVVAGTFMALVLAFLPFPGSKVIERWLGAVVSFPTFLIPLALGVLFGSAGVLPNLLAPLNGGTPPQWEFMSALPGIVLAEVIFFTPFVARPVTEALRRIPPAQLDVAESLGASTGTILRRIVLPAVAPVVSSAAALTLLLTLNEIGIVLFTGAKSVTTLPMLIYTNAIVTFDLGTASVLACLQVAMSTGLYLLYRALDRSA